MANRSEYEIDIVDGLYRIAPRGSDGIDRFADIETLQFRDMSLTQEDWLH